MGPIRCEVHEQPEKPLRLVRIRATAFQDKKDKFIVRVTSIALTSPSGRMTLESKVVRIGSAQDNHVVINDPNVSPYHAEIRTDGQGELRHTIINLGSTTNTFVNERRLDYNVPLLLHPNDAICVGDTVFTYERKSACFKAEYADDTYMKKRKLTGDNLVFMRKKWRDLLEVHPPENSKPPDQVELEKIPENDSLYEVHTGLSDDSNEGRIYIFNEQLYDKIEGKRPIARIKRKGVKPVYSEALYADDFYLEKWQEKWKKKGTEPNFCKLIFISAWYRFLLGTDVRKEIKLEVDLLNAEPSLVGRLQELCALLYFYPRDHPQAVVRTANMVAMIALGLGVIGTGLGLLGLKDSLGPIWSLIGFIVCIVVGLAFTVLGIKGLTRRR